MHEILPPGDSAGLAISRESLAATRLWLPRMSLMSCLMAATVRDTRPLALADEQRFNFFPATPCCAISLFFEGSAEIVEATPGALGDRPRTPVPRVAFSGPLTGPLINRNPGPVHAMMLLLMPDALAALTGIDPGRYLNRTVPAEDVLPPTWLALCRAVFDAPDDDRRVALVEERMDAWWRVERPAGSLASRLMADWTRGLQLHAANVGLGRSARQVERRIKQWTGQPLRELRGVGKAERAFFATVVANEKGPVHWADLATDAGFADQSHLCRQTRRITGFAPEELRRRISTDEGFWIYRAWGFVESHEWRGTADATS